MTSERTIDYAAEVRRTRLAQGLDPHVPQHLRDAVADLLRDDSDHTKASSG